MKAMPGNESVYLAKENHIHLRTVDSTNNYIKSASIMPGFWVTAEEQTSGRGRGLNKWHSIGDERVIFSGKYLFTKPIFPIHLFPLFSGSAVLFSLLEMAPELENKLRLKWPNDIYFEDKKISGILVESEFLGDFFTVIIGIGINIFGNNSENLPDSGFLFHIKPSTDFQKIFIHRMIKNLNLFIRDLEMNNIDPRLQWIEEHSYLSKKKIQFRKEKEILTAEVLGITNKGFLRIQTADGLFDELMDTGPDFKVIK